MASNRLAPEAIDHPMLRFTSINDPVRPAESVTLRGFVNDLDPLLASARFAICPVFGGTGQQIKIVEAIARGLPVVALRRHPVDNMA